MQRRVIVYRDTVLESSVLGPTALCYIIYRGKKKSKVVLNLMILQPMPNVKQKVKAGYSSGEASGRLSHAMWVYNPSVHSSERQRRIQRQHSKAVRPRSVGLAAPGKVFA